MAGNPLTFESPFETYTAVKQIGEGGAGRVYEVRSSDGSTHAIKTLAPERINSERLKRFKNEVTFCEQCENPSVLKVIDAGSMLVKGKKCPFYVMRLYPATLRSLIGRLSADDALRVFAQILNGVEAAHLAKVWHRDLKPENILCTADGKSVVVADFGIAHFEEEELYTAVETKAASRLANFQYAAPEQRTRGSAVDFRADIYSLGLILNELFVGDVPHGAGYKKISDGHPSYAYLDGLVEAMIQQSPQNRLQSIDAIKRELIGRGNAFVAQQKLDIAKKQVVLLSEPQPFKPLEFVDFDYQDGRLILKMNANAPSPEWVEEFQHPRGGHSSWMGYGPEYFQFSGNTASIASRDASPTHLQGLIDFAKQYIQAANKGYSQRLAEKAARDERDARQRIERQVKDAEDRKKLFAALKL